MQFTETKGSVYIRKELNSHRIALVHHREHTILLSRERVNKGTERMNSLRLSLHLISSILRDFTGKTTALQILRHTVALNSYLGFSALSNCFFFGLYKILQGRQLFPKTF